MKNLADHPVVVVLGALAALVAVLSCLTGYTTLPELVRELFLPTPTARVLIVTPTSLGVLPTSQPPLPRPRVHPTVVVPLPGPTPEPKTDPTPVEDPDTCIITTDGGPIYKRPAGPLEVNVPAGRYIVTAYQESLIFGWYQITFNGRMGWLIDRDVTEKSAICP